MLKMKKEPICSGMEEKLVDTLIVAKMLGSLMSNSKTCKGFQIKAEQ